MVGGAGCRSAVRLVLVGVVALVCAASPSVAADADTTGKREGYQSDVVWTTASTVSATSSRDMAAVT